MWASDNITEKFGTKIWNNWFVNKCTSKILKTMDIGSETHEYFQEHYFQNHGH